LYSQSLTVEHNPAVTCSRDFHQKLNPTPHKAWLRYERKLAHRRALVVLLVTKPAQRTVSALYYIKQAFITVRP
jgi:hypothetical protein